MLMGVTIGMVMDRTRICLVKMHNAERVILIHQTGGRLVRIAKSERQARRQDAEKISESEYSPRHDPSRPSQTRKHTPPVPD